MAADEIICLPVETQKFSTQVDADSRVVLKQDSLTQEYELLLQFPNIRESYVLIPQNSTGFIRNFKDVSGKVQFSYRPSNMGGQDTALLLHPLFANGQQPVQFVCN